MATSRRRRRQHRNPIGFNPLVSGESPTAAIDRAKHAAVQKAASAVHVALIEFERVKRWIKASLPATVPESLRGEVAHMKALEMEAGTRLVKAYDALTKVEKA